MRNCLLAIDPGLDAMGCAVYAMCEIPSLWIDRPELALRWVQTVRTDTADPLLDRLTRLGNLACTLADAYQCGTALIEQPAFAGTYQRNRRAVGRDGMAAGMGKLHLALGFVAGALVKHGLDVQFVGASGIPKQRKQLLAKSLYEHAAKVRPVHISTRLPSADALDAVFLGAAQLPLVATVQGSRLTRPLTGTR